MSIVLLFLLAALLGVLAGATSAAVRRNETVDEIESIEEAERRP